MTILFGNLGDGETMRAFSAFAAFASLGAIMLAGEAEQYAGEHRPAPSLTSFSGPAVAGLSQPRLDEVDYATTGSLAQASQRTVVLLGSCGDIFERR